MHNQPSNMEDLFCGLQNPLYRLAADTVAKGKKL
jgi:hypothetical protein